MQEAQRHLMSEHLIPQVTSSLVIATGQVVIQSIPENSPDDDGGDDLVIKWSVPDNLYEALDLAFLRLDTAASA